MVDVVEERKGGKQKTERGKVLLRDDEKVDRGDFKLLYYF